MSIFWDVSYQKALKVFKLFQAAIIIAHGDILRSMALLLGANRLLAMANDMGGFCPIIVGEVFFQFISHSYSFEGHFRSIYPLINSKFSTPRGCETIFFGIRAIFDLHLDWVVM